MKEIKLLPPFKNFILQNFPFIEEDFDALTNYELLCHVVNYVKTMGDDFNDIIFNQNELNTAFTQLKSYIDNFFETLDLQDEVNNKLDDMAESGELDQIIQQYLNSSAIWGFDSVADMKAAENLIDGSYAKTLGYYAKNDGGGAIYKIRKITNDDVVDEASIIAIGSNDLIAELIITEDINVNQFGAKGDGVTNDTSAFNKAITFTNYLNLVPNKTYKLTKLEIDKDFTLHGNGATLIDDTSVDKFIESSIGQRHELKFDNMIIDLSHSTYGIYLTHTRFIGESLTIKGASTADVVVYTGTTAGAYGWIDLRNSKIQSSQTGIDLHATDCVFTNIESYNCMTHYNIAGGLTHLNKVHGWNYNVNSTDWITGSKLIDAKADIVASDVYSDTLETCINLNSNTYITLLFQNVNMFLNRDSYPSTQNDPMLFRNVSTFNSATGSFCRVDGLYINNNDWRNSSNEYAESIPEVNPTKIYISNVGTAAVKTNHFRPIFAHGDINNSEYTNSITSYLSWGTRKYNLKDYSIEIFSLATLKTALPNNTEIFDADFSNSSTFGVMDRSTMVNAYYFTSSGDITPLAAHVDSSHKLHVYNHSGSSLNGGTVIINMRYNKVNY